MSRTPERPVISMPTEAEDEAINRAARADPDALPLTATQLKAMVPMRTHRGRPKSATSKQLVSVRYSQEVLAYFKATGEGWQARMDSVLLKYVSRQSRGSRN